MKLLHDEILFRDRRLTLTGNESIPRTASAIGPEIRLELTVRVYNIRIMSRYQKIVRNWM